MSTLYLDRNEGAPGKWNRYPDASALERAIAERFDVDPARVLVTAGADDALDRAWRVLLRGGGDLVTPAPTFSTMLQLARAQGARIRSVAWWEGALPVDELCNAIDDDDVRACIVTTPNNPTGAVAGEDELAACTRGVPLVVDLAYSEFADRDPSRAVVRLPDTLAVKTFSKAFGAAGLRVGYAIGPRAWIDAMRKTGNPYPVAAPSLDAAGRLLDEGCAPRVEAVRRERDELARALRRLGAAPYPSEANFVLARWPDAAVARAQAEAWQRRGLRVRQFDGELEACLRISCPGDAPVFERLLDVLESSR